MTTSKRSRNLFLLLLISLALYFFFGESSETETNNKRVQSNSARPNAFSTQSQMAVYNTQGQPYLTINSNETRHYEGLSKVTILGPSIHYRAETGTQYSLKAELGDYYQRENLLDLEGDVVISLFEGTEEQINTSIPALTLHSEKLSFDLAKRFISTDQAVSIEQGKHTLHSQGMHVLLNQKTLKLLNRVRGRYVID